MRTANGGHVRSPNRADFIQIPRFDPLAFLGRLICSAPVIANLIALAIVIAALVFIPDVPRPQ